LVYLETLSTAWNFKTLTFKIAEACSGASYRIENSDDIKPTPSLALSEKSKPVMVEGILDPNEPPYPAKLGLKYIENFAKALAKGEPHGGKIALPLFREKISEKL
jgi:hypothetical protein